MGNSAAPRFDCTNNSNRRELDELVAAGELLDERLRLEDSLVAM
jgi:hypothetical protein